MSKYVYHWFQYILQPSRYKSDTKLAHPNHANVLLINILLLRINNGLKNDRYDNNYALYFL